MESAYEIQWFNSSKQEWVHLREVIAADDAEAKRELVKDLTLTNYAVGMRFRVIGILQEITIRDPFATDAKIRAGIL